VEVALRRTYDATPDPKLVVAVPGCPPRPNQILSAILAALERSS